MTTVQELLKQNNVNISIPEIWQEFEMDDENEYAYKMEEQDEGTIHVLQTEGYDRMGNKGYDEIIIDLNGNKITFMGADGVMTQYDDKGNITDRTV